SASRIAFTSAVTCAPDSCQAAARSSYGFPSFSPTVFLRIPSRLRSVRRRPPLVNADWTEAAGLKNPHQFQPNHLEQCQERHDQAGSVFDIGKEIFEAAGFGLG